MGHQSKPIRVTAVGMDERMKNALRLFFQGPCKNYCVLVEEESAEIGIIDLDAYQGQNTCNEYRNRHPNQPVILISLHETTVENGFFLRKPLNAKELVGAIKQTKQTLLPDPPQASHKETATSTPAAKPTSETEVIKLDTHKRKEASHAPTTHHAAMYLEEHDAKVLIGTAPDIDPTDPAQLLNAQYHPNDFLQGHFSRACKIASDSKRCVQMDTPRGPIYLLPNCERVLIKFSESQLRTLSVVPINDASVSISVMNSIYPLEQDLSSSISRDALLWKTALWASRGRVPSGTDLNTPVYLSHWPNLTRLLLFPHALRIAALWANQTYSLLDTAQTLAIPQRHVFSFYSAACALELAMTSRRAVDSLLEPPPLQQNRRHGLLSRILNRLRA